MAKQLTKAEMTRFAAIAKSENVCIEVVVGERTVRFSPAESGERSARDAEQEELDRDLAEFDAKHGYKQA